MLITAQEREYLLSSMRTLLNEYDYDFTIDALDEIIDTWVEAKANLIQAFKKHPNYIEGKFMIAFDTDYERVVNKKGSSDFSRYILQVSSESEFINNLPKEINDQRIAELCICLPNDIYDFLYNLSYIATRTITAETADNINEMMPNIHAHTGEKTSRVINKICTYLGYNKSADYNREFAKYADSLSPLKITRHTILSINPLDYLTMSFGNSWSSCHTIDKRNKRHMPNGYEGQYSSGTVSYMLDATSMVFYTVDAAYDGQEYWNEPKINRQMFHYGEEKLIQSRLYPQSNDGCGEDYTPNRNIVQKIIADIYEFPNLWIIRKGCTPASEYVRTRGTHYPDYTHFSDCSISRLKGSVNEEVITIGASPICIECGCTHDEGSNINCCAKEHQFCECCGCLIKDEDDEVWIDDSVYCRDCVSYCDLCGEYHRGEDYYIRSDDIYVCEYCLDNYYYMCNDCGEYVHRDDAIYVDQEDFYICPDCYDMDYVTCSQCEEVLHRDGAEYLEDTDEYVCLNCYEELEEEVC